MKFRARAFCQFSRALGTLLEMSLYRDRIVAVIVNPADLALLVAIDAFILARGLHPDDIEQAVDWGKVFPAIQTFDL